MKKERVLVTGAAGFLGSHVCDALIAKDHTVVGVDDLSGGFTENLDCKIDFVNCDISDACSMERLWQEKGPFQIDVWP